jgi:tetratricopeptide (TPR) repeat protein
MTAAPPEALPTQARMAAARPASRPTARPSTGPADLPATTVTADLRGPAARTETKPTVSAAPPAVFAAPAPPGDGDDDPSTLAAPPDGDDDPAGDELEEAAFFIAQGDLETARDVLETVLLAFPANARAKELMAELEAKESGGVGGDNAEAITGGDQSFDLAAELAEELGEQGGEAESQPLQPGEDGFQISHEDVFSEFKKGVSKVVKAEDGETHYDLGVAYKEMGLTMDAVSEFELAMAAFAGKPREVDCYASIAACKRDLGDDDGAADAYRAALALPQISPDATKATLYELAACHEGMNELKKALSHYQKVLSLDPKYRDAAACAARLKDQGIVAEETANGVHLNGKKGGDGGNGAPAATSSARPPSGSPATPGGKPPSRKIGYV